MSDVIQDIPETWKLRRLDEVATITDSLHETPSYTEDGYPMVRVTDINGGYLDLSGTVRVSEEVFKEFTRRRVPQRGDIVFSRVGTYGNASYVATDSKFCLGQNTALISSTINSRFLHLFLQSPYARHQIEQSVVGSSQKTISLKNISALEILVPPDPELTTITHILGTLDEKIELNRRINETLEAMARAIFKSWFVDFDPVRAKVEGRDPGQPKRLADLFPARLVDSELGETPEGWEVGSFGSLISQRTERVGPREVVVLSAIASGKLARSDDHFTKRVYSMEKDNYLCVEQWDFAYNPSRINIGSIYGERRSRDQGESHADSQRS